MTVPSIDERTWYRDGDTLAFLVYAPITFGHTQLKLSVPSGTLEEIAFASAAKHVTKCIERFRTVFADLKPTEWEFLANYTETAGQYRKTLILKSSAIEDDGEYKLHLLPCFSSHLELANESFWARVDPKRQDLGGGLLHWVGMREDTVDRDTQRLNAAGEARIESFKLIQLAAKLRGPF